MDIGFDSTEWRPTPARRAAQGLLRHAPDWTELLARLDAARAAHREMAASLTGPAGRCGSFDRGAALAIAGFDHASCSVNPTALANRKPDGGNAVCVTGNFATGARG